MVIKNTISLFALVFLCALLNARVTVAEEGLPALELAFQQYFLPDESDLTVPVVTVGWEQLLLQGRYNYEGRDVASLWTGLTYSFGDEVTFEITPLIGAIFGEIEGAAPGGLVDINWNRLNLYSEFEYVFDFGTREDNFFYSWSQVTYSVIDELRLGVVGSRTRAYSSSVEVDHGPIIELDIGPVTASFTVLNIDTDAIVVAGLAGSF